MDLAGMQLSLLFQGLLQVGKETKALLERELPPGIHLHRELQIHLKGSRRFSAHGFYTQKPCTAPCNSSLNEMCLFTAVYVESFQQVTFHFLMSI